MPTWEEEEEKIRKHEEKKAKNKKHKKWSSGQVGQVVHDKTVLPPIGIDVHDDKVDQLDTAIQLDQLDQLDHLNNKHKILLLLLNNNFTIKQISTKLKINIDTISCMIRREARKTGLYYDDLVEIVSEENNCNCWGLTDKGRKHIQTIIDKQKQHDYEKQRKEDKANKIKEYRTRIKLYLEDVDVTHKKYVYLNFIDIIKQNPDFGEALEDDYTEQMAMCKAILKDQTERNIDVTITNVPNRLLKPIQKLGVDDYNKLLVIEGMIKGRSDRRAQVTRSVFECNFCGDQKVVLQTEKHFRNPPKCECGKGTTIHFPDQDELVEVQTLDLEEFSENLKGVNEPRSIKLLLKNSLCSPSSQKNFNPGMRLKFWGTLKRDWKFDNNRKKTLLDHYFEVNGYEVLDQSLEFSVKEKDKKEILNFIKKENFLELLSKSFCPHIIGNSNIKKALLVSAVKGMKQLPVLNRDRIHTLLVSNPGQGKTVMVKKLSEITPYSRFTSGLNSSKAGLTASVVKDEFLGGWRLSAGAVPLANNGVCVIDELDKFNDDDKKSLNSVMEEGEVVVDKATVHQKLLANTVIVANCNPSNEVFDEHETRIKQLNLPKSLIDRFDFIFVLEDQNDGNPFLKSIEEDYTNFVSEEFISKFLILAMNNKPVMTTQIMKYIAEISYNLKIGYKEFNFGFRQHNALFRISFAISKLNFHNEVTMDDVREARDLLIESYNSLNISFDGVLI